MITIAELHKAVEDALAYISKLPDIVEAAIFASANAQNFIRFDYKSHILCNGVEEPKSTKDYGIGVQAVFKTPEGIKVGFGSEANNISLDGIKIALEKAREGAVLDEEFVSLPKPIEIKRTLYNYHDPNFMEMKDDDFISAGWKILDGAIREFLGSDKLIIFAKKLDKEIARLGLIEGGDLTIICERMAIASTAMPEAQTDESAFATVSLTAMVEDYKAKGSGYNSYKKILEINNEAGRKSAQNAINACGVFEPEHEGQSKEFREPVGFASGAYPVIFGEQPVSEFLNNFFIPSLKAGSFYGQESPFMGMFGKQIASPLINIYDDAANPEYVGAKGITCEGLPTKRTELVKEGILNDVLSSWYETQRLLHHDPQAQEKLGADPKELWRQGKLLPTSGFRFATGGGRSYGSYPGISGTNIVLEGTISQPLEELIKEIAFGLYIGRIWYCYPMNGLRAGDFTATIIADSFVIKNGKIVSPLKANAVRINDNFVRILKNIKSVSNKKETALIWAADEIPIACDILVTGVKLEEIKEADAAPTGM